MLFFDPTPKRAYGSIYCQPRPGCRWHLAVRWARAARSWHRTRIFYAHPPASFCRLLVHRAFRPLGPAWVAWTDRVLNGESGAHWDADNPLSTASGPWQMLDSWGPLSVRQDCVLSTHKALRAVKAGGADRHWTGYDAPG